MNQKILTKTVARLMKIPKGILAIDESLNTSAGRFLKLGVPNTEEKRREYRELLITAPKIEKYISGYILFDETIKQKTVDGKSFVSVLNSKGIEIGIKVDAGTTDFLNHTGEKTTKGLEGLGERLKEYKKLGATFAKWRAVYTIGIDSPSIDCMNVNAGIFAKYAKLCQENDIVPIVEPEILIDGNHTVEKCFKVTAQNLDKVFSELKRADVFIPGMILKTSMVISGKTSRDKPSSEKVAEMTLKCLKEHVPSDIGGIVFLSGGQSDEDAILNLNAMHKVGKLPWPLTFSYGRAIQNSALVSWAKNPSDVIGAQKLLLTAAKANSLASVGKYK